MKNLCSDIDSVNAWHYSTANPYLNVHPNPNHHHAVENLQFSAPRDVGETAELSPLVSLSVTWAV